MKKKILVNIHNTQDLIIEKIELKILSKIVRDKEKIEFQLDQSNY